jgi:hypothetical protein
MAITHITNHYELAVARLPQVYKDKPKFLAWLGAYCTRIQNIEDAVWAVYVGRMLQNDPTGNLLVKLGIIVGQSSLGYSDAVFRLLIKARIPTNKSDGRKPTMIKIASLLAPGLTIEAYTVPLTTFYMQVDGPYTVDPYVMFNSFLSQAIGAGVRLVFVWTGTAATSTLIMGDSGGGFTPTASQSPGDTNSAPYGGGLIAGTV